MDKLLKRLESPAWEQRAFTVMGLGSSDDPRVTPLLIKALGDPESEVRARAVGELLCREGLTIDDLRESLESPDANRRSAALSVLASFQKEAVPLLLELAKDDDRHVRMTAVMELKCIDPETGIPALKALLADEEMPADLIEQMAQWGVPIPPGELLANLENNLRMIAAAQKRKREWLAERYRDADASALEDALKIKDFEEKRHAVLMLGENGDSRSVPALLRALDDRSWVMRGYIANALEAILDRCDAEGFEAWLMDGAEHLNMNAARHAAPVISHLKDMVAERKDMGGVLSESRLRAPKRPGKSRLKR